MPAGRKVAAADTQGGELACVQLRAGKVLQRRLHGGVQAREAAAHQRQRRKVCQQLRTQPPDQPACGIAAEANAMPDTRRHGRRGPGMRSRAPGRARSRQRRSGAAARAVKRSAAPLPSSPADCSTQQAYRWARPPHHSTVTGVRAGSMRTADGTANRLSSKSSSAAQRGGGKRKGRQLSLIHI